MIYLVAMLVVVQLADAVSTTSKRRMPTTKKATIPVTRMTATTAARKATLKMSSSKAGAGLTHTAKATTKAAGGTAPSPTSAPTRTSDVVAQQSSGWLLTLAALMQVAFIF